MNIAIIGATGNIGRRILAEALSRGHALKAIVRPESREKLKGESSVTIAEADIFDEVELAGVLDKEDVVISAYGPGNKTQEFVAGVRAQLEAVHRFAMPGDRGYSFNELANGPGKNEFKIQIYETPKGVSNCVAYVSMAWALETTLGLESSSGGSLTFVYRKGDWRFTGGE